MSRYAGEAWLKVAAGGGWWSLDEIKAQMPEASRKRVQETMWSMERRGSVTRHEDGRYGITHDCTIPSGLTVTDVMRAMGVGNA